MIKQTRTLLLASIAVIAVSVIGYTVADSGNSEAATTMDGGKLLGHITLVAYDPNGHIKQYVQTDNLVVDQGEACALKAVTGSTTAATDCVGSPGTFNVIALGTSATAVNADQVALVAETAVSGLARATVTGNVVANDPAASGATATLTKTFIAGVAGPTAITEAGIFNSTSTTADGMFARNQFTAISLALNDQLALTWTITFAG